MKVGDLVKHKFDAARSKVYVVLEHRSLKVFKGSPLVMATLYHAEQGVVFSNKGFGIDHLEVISESN